MARNLGFVPAFFKDICNVRNSLTTLLLLLSCCALGQVPLTSGAYQEMNIAYDQANKIITGFYENYTGYDEATRQPRFSCIFYLLGKITADSIKVRSFFPGDDSADIIDGQLIVLNSGMFKIHLQEEHGGCWNVEHFAGEPAEFRLDRPNNWIQIRFANKSKVYFYADKSEARKQKAYIIKGNVVYIEKIDGEWAWGSYIDKNVTKGWLKLSDLNKLD